jgi:hypothetical protein
MTQDTPPVEQVEVIALLEYGFRNVDLPPLSGDDIGDIADGLTAFLGKRLATEACTSAGVERAMVAIGDRVTIKHEREVYGDGTVVGVEANCVKVAWDKDPRVLWSFPDDIEVLPRRVATLPAVDAGVVELLKRAQAHIAATVHPIDRDGITRRLLADISAALAPASANGGDEPKPTTIKRRSHHNALDT